MNKSVESIIKKEIDLQPQRVTEIDEGIQHTTFEVVSEEAKYILQFTDNEGRELNLLHKNAYWYNRLEDSRLPTPEVLSDGVERFEDKWYILVESLPGEDAGEDITKKRTTQAGQNLAKLHNYESFENFGFPEVSENGDVSVTSSNYQEWLIDMFEDSIDRFSEHDLDSLSGKLQSISEEFKSEIPSNLDLVICHNDYSPDNILYDENDRLTGIVDFDISYVGHRHRDTAKAANSFWMHDPLVSWDVRETFYRGYNEVSELDESFYQNEGFYRLESLVVTISYLIDLGLLSEEEKVSFYENAIEDVIESF